MEPGSGQSITEEERLEQVREVLLISEEKLLSFCDNAKGRRFRSAASDIFFASERLCDALLRSIGVEARSHEAIVRLTSKHFAKPGLIHPRIIRYLGNLRDRRNTADYSVSAGWEFKEDEAKAYLSWFDAILEAVSPLMAKNTSEISGDLERLKKETETTKRLMEK